MERPLQAGREPAPSQPDNQVTGREQSRSKEPSAVPSRGRCERAKSRSIGVADGSIMAIIMTPHMAVVATRSSTSQGVARGIAIPMAMCMCISLARRHRSNHVMPTSAATPPSTTNWVGSSNRT